MGIMKVNAAQLPLAAGEWISRAGPLNQQEMENNADIVISTYQKEGIAKETIAAILGNMQNESSVNPEREEQGGAGYGLVQWTPVSVLQNHCQALGLSPYTSGDVQLKVLLAEIRGESGTNEWYSSEAFISNFYNSGATPDMVGITGKQFLSNSMGWDAGKLAILFMAAYERPSYDPGTNHWQSRRDDAKTWFDYIGGGGGVTFTPRLTKQGMNGSKYWYSSTNPFYPTYGLPNCTCYAWGRFWEICGESNVPTLPTGNGGEWWNQVGSKYEKGSTPKLGAVLCLEDPGGAGHVCIVEEIKGDTITTSNSGYSRNPGGYDDPKYFWVDTNKKSNNYLPSWAAGYRFQGFIYNPCVRPGPKPPTPVYSSGKIWMYLKKRRF